MTLGIIDVGTNSIHLLVGILGLRGAFHVILKERDLTRLGEGGLARGRLTRAAMRRAMGVLDRYAMLMKRCRVDHVEAVATSAVREAGNGREFVAHVRKRLGVPLRVISGREEARLIYLGVAQTERFRRPVLIITIGGGSAQVVDGQGTQLRYAVSLPLGGARLAQQFIHHDPPKSKEVDALRTAVDDAWKPVVRALRRSGRRQALGSSATIAQLMMAAYVREHGREPKAKRSLTMARDSLRELVGWLTTSSARERLQLEGLDPRREDLALPTGIALLSWMESCGIATLRYAPGSVREGLVIDYLIRHHQRAQRIGDPLAEMLGYNGGDLLGLRPSKIDVASTGSDRRTAR